ncbi:Protein of unknown function, partial [Gryllus bimaculatus]
DVLLKLSCVAYNGWNSAQEIIKTGLRKNAPKQHFFFNPLKCIGYSACLTACTTTSSVGTTPTSALKSQMSTGE